MDVAAISLELGILKIDDAFQDWVVTNGVLTKRIASSVGVEPLSAFTGQPLLLAYFLGFDWPMYRFNPSSIKHFLYLSYDIRMLCRYIVPLTDILLEVVEL